jgi:hypothetical protein
MPYKLKPNEPDFIVVDGDLAGRRFVAGEVYEKVPMNEAHKFQEIKKTGGKGSKSPGGRGSDETSSVTGAVESSEPESTGGEA